MAKHMTGEQAKCECGAALIQVVTVEHWAPQDRPWEVCANNHWHKPLPVQAQDEGKGAVGVELPPRPVIWTHYDKPAIGYTIRSTEVAAAYILALESSLAVERARAESKQLAFYNDGYKKGVEAGRFERDEARH